MPGRLAICSSSHRLTPEAEKKIQLFEPTEIKKLGGAGNKILNIIKGEVDIYYY